MSEPIRVLFAHVGGNWLRGSELALLELLEGLDKAEFAPLLVCDQPAMADAARNIAGVLVEQHAFPEIMIDTGQMDINVPAVMGLIGDITRLARRHRSELIYCNSALPFQSCSFAAQWLGLPTICHFHADYNRRYHVLYRLARVDEVIFVCSAARDFNLRKGRFRSVNVVLNGVNLERFCPGTIRSAQVRAELGIPADGVVALQTGSLISRKGYDLTLEALARCKVSNPNLYVVFAGDGPELDKAQALAAQLSVSDRVRFAGNVDRLEHFYRNVADLVCLPSRSDVLPLSLLEAAGCGLPAISTKVGGIPDAIVHGETGLLVEAEDVEGLARGFQTLAGDCELRQRMGRNARRRAEAMFSRSAYVAAIRDIIVRTARREQAPAKADAHVSKLAAS